MKAVEGSEVFNHASTVAIFEVPMQLRKSFFLGMSWKPSKAGLRDLRPRMPGSGPKRETKSKFCFRNWKADETVKVQE